LAGLVWLLSRTLGSHTVLYAGKPIDYWRQQLSGKDITASNQAYAIVSSQVIPQLLHTIFQDTNDSQLRLGILKFLNTLPGVQIDFVQADARRAWAVGELGQLGPPARAAVPDLIRVAKGKDLDLRDPALFALGDIHSEPDLVIPVLIGFLDDDAVKDGAAQALGDYGLLAKAALPKLLPLCHSKDKEVRNAARNAVKKIDPAQAAKAAFN
jgi:HEAT repeat protein